MTVVDAPDASATLSKPLRFNGAVAAEEGGVVYS